MTMFLFMFGSCLASPRVICNCSKVEDTTFSSTSSLTIPSHIIPNIFPKMSKDVQSMVPISTTHLCSKVCTDVGAPSLKSGYMMINAHRIQQQNQQFDWRQIQNHLCKERIHVFLTQDLKWQQSMFMHWVSDKLSIDDDEKGELLSCQSCMNLHFTISIGSFPKIMALQSSWIPKRFSHVPTDFIFNSKILKKKSGLHTHGLTLFLLKRPSEMMMLIWPWCVFFDPKKTPFVQFLTRWGLGWRDVLD